VERLLAVPLIACLAAIAVVVAFARDRAPTPYAITALVITAIAYVPFLRLSRPTAQAIGLAVFGLLTIPVGWMFGSSSASAAVFTLIILLVGVRYSALGATLFYATTAGGQAIVATLVLSGNLADDSILPLLVPGHPLWHHAIAHAAIQLVYLTALLSSRAFQSRYRRLSSDLDTAIQVAARRASLLDEARAEYLRTLALGRQGIFSGQTIGEFRLGELIGRGGAGEVYDARAEDGTIVAMKLLRGDRLRDPAAIQSFIDETNAAMRIDSPHVARATQVGGLDAAMPYIAMEKLDGTSLRSLLLERGALSRDDLRALAAGACAALAAVHAANLAHGDVSPQNLIRTTSPRLDRATGAGIAERGASGIAERGSSGIAERGTGIAERGTSSIAERGASGIAERGTGIAERGASAERGGLDASWKLIDFGARAAVGTPRFVAPELLANPETKPTPASDLYGLAACLYAAATGEDPFADVPLRQLAHFVATHAPLDPRLRADVSDDLARVLQIGLALSPSDRFASADELRAALLAALDGSLDSATRASASALAPWSVALPAIETEATDEVARASRASERAIRQSAPTIRRDEPARAIERVTANRASEPAIVARASEPAIVSRASEPAITAIGGEIANLDFGHRSGQAASSPDASTRRPTSGDADDQLDSAHRSGQVVSSTYGAGNDAVRTKHVLVAEATPRSSERIDATIDATRDAAWEDAHRDKLLRQRIGILATCVGGALLLSFILREREALWAAWIGIAGIALTVALHRSTTRWPWVIVGALSVGPAFALGLHSGFAAIVALAVFAGRLFRAPWTSRNATAWKRALEDDRLILVAIVVGHTIAFVLVAVGVVPDAGNTPVTYAGMSPATGWVIHASTMLTYVAVFVTAAWIDRDFDRLVRKNEVALRDAAQKEALLSTARAELDRALAGETGGLFTGSTMGGYAVEKLIGRGGMGEVYEARRDGNAVALKVIRADRISSAEALRRFAREASTLQKVESPYVSRVLEVGSDERVPFLVMELVQGATLAELMRENERLDDASARAMIRDISRGLEDVHCAGVLHRDVKPSNLVRMSNGQWKLVDFGIAKFLDGPWETTGNLVVGTPPFMAPEQLTGRGVDERADVFSLCAVIYRALMGRPAWTTQTALAAVRVQPADPSATLRADLVLALRIGLATRPADRFATSIELGAAFDAAFQDRLDDGYRRRAQAILAREPWAPSA
jgi:serine/threonine protein kinase